MSEFMELMEGWEGYQEINRSPSPTAVAAAMDLMSNKAGFSPLRHAANLEEAITTTDFPDLFGFIIERDILARYTVAQADWRSYCAAGVMPNYNVGRMHKIQGNEQRLPRVAEKGEYLVAPMSDSYYPRQVLKYGRQFDISGEAIVNDVMDAMGDMPQRFAAAALATEAWEVTTLLAGAAAPNAALYGAPIADVDGQNVTNLGILPLTIANLETTLQLAAAQTDILGRPITVRGVHIVIPPALEITLRQILTSAYQQWTEVGAGAGVPMPTTNVLPQMGLQMHVDPMLPVRDLVGGNTTWYVFAEPSQGKAIQLDFLRGFETPEICMKASDKVTTTGAPLGPFSGDFATDNIFYRVRHIVGGAELDPRFTYAQVGP